MMATATPNNNNNGNGKNNNGKPPTSAAAGDDVEAVGESTPLLHSGSGNGGEDNNDDSNTSNEPPPLQEMKAESLKERAVAVTAGVSFLSSIAAIILEATAHPVVWVSGILGAILAPYAAMQQQKLTQVEALNQTNERMEQEVEQLAAENVRLSKQVQEMEESVINLKAMEDTLETLQSVQGVSMVELEGQLRESQEIWNTLDRDLQSEIVRALVGVILGADTDQDFLLSDAEIDDIIHKMEAIHGVQLKEDLLKSIVIEQGRSIKSIMALARNLMQENDPGKNIFSFIET